MLGTGTAGHIAIVTAFCFLLGWAAVSDLQRRVIPNRISVAILALYPAHALTLPAAAIGPSVAVAVGVLIFGMFAFVRGWIGGGDVKLLSVAALWAGWPLAVELAVITSLFGAVLALSWIALARYFPPLFPSIAAANGRTEMPYGVAIAAGGVYVAARLV
jgi:prepilin peptidase CpaA